MRVLHSLGRIMVVLYRCVGAGLAILAGLTLVTWASLAIFFSNLPSAWLRPGLALGFAAFATWALWFSRRRWATVAACLLFIGVVVWWNTIRPSNARPWQPEVAVMPRAYIDGDRVRITGVRDFDYRSVDDFTIHYEDRDVQLSHLTGIDFYVSYWSKGTIGRLIGHTFLSFDFDNAPPLCISIEVRPVVGQDYDPIGSLFKQYELIYVVGNEEDLVRVRTNYRREAVYLYHLNTAPEAVRRLFRIYLSRINELADHPEFYNLLSNNCTLNIIRYANAAGREGGFSIRHLFNGLIDTYLYYSGRLDTALSFAQVRRLSLITQVAQAADHQPGFSARIRASLPTIIHH